MVGAGRGVQVEPPSAARWNDLDARAAPTYPRHGGHLCLTPVPRPASRRAGLSRAWLWPQPAGYTLNGMSGLYDVELEPEVRSWLESLSEREYAKVEAACDLLAEFPETLGEPYTRHLSGKVRELRFHLDRIQARITYWLAPGQRIVLLTVFRKTRMAERREVERAVRAWQACASGHPDHAPAHLVYERKWEDE
jgi:hypothetical protein